MGWAGRPGHGRARELLSFVAARARFSDAAARRGDDARRRGGFRVAARRRGGPVCGERPFAGSGSGSVACFVSMRGELPQFKLLYHGHILRHSNFLSDGILILGN